MTGHATCACCGQPAATPPDPVPLRRAKKFVRRPHRARLKNRGKPWV